MGFLVSGPDPKSKRTKHSLTQTIMANRLLDFLEPTVTYRRQKPLVAAIGKYISILILFGLVGLIVFEVLLYVNTLKPPQHING
jgi:large-conductance mechanosensitive channel